MRRLSSMFCRMRGTRTVRWLRTALSLLQLLSSRRLEVMLLWTANDTCRRLTQGGMRAFDVLESLSQKLNRNLEIADLICFVGDISDLVSQHFDVGRVVVSGTQWYVALVASTDDIFAKLIDNDHYLADFVLDAKEVVTYSLNLLFVVLDHAVVKGDLLLEPDDGMANVTIARRADYPRMLVSRCVH